MIETIRRVAWTAVAGAAVLVAPRASGQQTSDRTNPRALPESPTLVPTPVAPSLGPSPGALEASSFAPPDAGTIGGKARGGLGRVPRRLLRSSHSPMTAASRLLGAMSLPEALTEVAPAPTSAGMSLALPALTEDEGPADGLTLDAAIARMIAANLDLLALKFEIPQADADILTAGLRANPLIYFDSQLIPYGSYSSARPVGPTEYDIIITHPLDISHKRRERVKVARAAKTVIEAQFQDVVRRQMANLYRAYVDLQTARINNVSGEAALREQEATAARMRPRLKAGDDASRLDVEIQKARDTLSEARDALDDAREAMAVLLDLPPDEASRLQPRGSLRDTAPPPPDLDELTRIALAARPDLAAARRGIHRAEKEVGLAKANRMDDVFLFYDPFTYQDNRISHQPSGRSWAVGVTVPLPLYNRNQGNIARAHANVSQSQVELAALERRVISEVRLAEREYRSSRVALDRAERGTLARAREARAKANADLALGTLGLVDYLDRLEEEADAARAYRDALVRHRRSMLDLNTAVGVRLLP